MEVDTQRLKLLCAQLGVTLEKEQLDQFVIYYSLLVEKNKVMNLTAITDWEDVVCKHFVDSLSLVKMVTLPAASMRVVDLGSGAGFPGIPLKIAFPSLDITLVDSLGKRVRFLEEVMEACSFQGIQAIHARAEDLAKDEAHREKYDLCVSRAVARLSTLSEYCLPFVRVGGSFVAYKAEKSLEEAKEGEKAAIILGGKWDETKDLCTFTLPGTDASRTLVRVRKIKKTPAKYPRKAGTPTRDPLM